MPPSSKRERETECKKSQIGTHITHCLAITNVLRTKVSALFKLPFNLSLLEISAMVNNEISKKITA